MMLQLKEPRVRKHIEIELSHWKQLLSFACPPLHKPSVGLIVEFLRDEERMGRPALWMLANAFTPS